MNFKLDKLNINKRLLVLVGVSVVSATTLISVSIYALSQANASLKTVYEDRLVPLQQLASISESMLNIEADYYNIAGETALVTEGKQKVTVLNKTVASEVVPQIQGELKNIDAQWKAYMATYLTPEEKILADKFIASKDAFITKHVMPGIPLIQKLNATETMKVADAIPEGYKAADEDINALQKLQGDVALQEFHAAKTRYDQVRIGAVLGMGLAIVLMAWVGRLVTRSITNPLNKAKQVFASLEQGDYNTPIDADGDDELSQVLQSLKSMQAKMKQNVLEQQALAKQVQDQATLFQAQLDAISKSTGMLEMDIDGNILKTNDLFLNSFGYTEQELVGKNRNILLDSKELNGEQNREILEKLKRGESYSGQIRRIAKDGKEVWLEATYNPILSAEGNISKVLQVVNYYRDITNQKVKDMDSYGQLNAIGRSQGVIELDLDGDVLKVNETYLDMLGYQEQELLGKNVSMVLDPTFANSSTYKELWAKLVNGGTDAGQYKRIGKGGKEVWIQTSYNPIKDINGKVTKIVNYTIDITDEKIKAADSASQLEAIKKIQGVIEFDLAGKILAVNDIFAALTGYSKEEIVGNHHSMFVDATYKASSEYKKFWEDLAAGLPNNTQFKRISKGGKEIWLQAIYNPILDLNGIAYKVVKFAIDITAQHNATVALEAAVSESQEVIESAKVGDLTSRVSLDGKTGAIASLCDGINAIMDKMTEVVMQVKDAGETINTAAGEIASGNNDLSSRTEQQASSLEETASSMEELASTVKQNAENAKQANQLAAAASGVAVKGGDVVGQVVNTMNAINQSAKKIEDIISVIDGIAFQTNILALNAAVEAARAGEQGRGFAVVAGEVRNLAQRSASAAKEIKELITDSVSKTAEGTTQVENAGKTMEEIVTSVQRVTDIMGEISAASNEQSTGIDQVNNAITSMDEVTQQNAALVEEAAAAAESLVEQAATLMDTVNAFKLAGSGNDRRATGSAMRSDTGRASPPRAPSRPVVVAPSKPVAAKVIAKTGTDDGDWEEF